MKVNRDALLVLDDPRIEIDGTHLRIPFQIDRRVYENVKKALIAAGGPWNRKHQAHVFATDPSEVIEQIILTGEVTSAQDLGFFPTPPAVVEQLLNLARLEPGMTVLEPSSGTGAIAVPLVAHGCVVDCIEIDEGRSLGSVHALSGARSVGIADFLALDASDFDEDGYDRVVMNPPFAQKADIRHVRHALRFVKPGGLLVAVMSNGVTFRTDRETTEFRDLVERFGGQIVPLPDDAFKPSGTGVRTVLVAIPAEL